MVIFRRRRCRSNGAYQGVMRSIESDLDINGELIRDIEFSPDCTQLIVRTRDASGSTLRVLDIRRAQEVELPVSLRRSIGS